MDRPDVTYSGSRKAILSYDRAWDEFLGIRTTGERRPDGDRHHMPYEPTGYAVLERLAASPYVNPGQLFCDFGSGLGRTAFFLNHALGCRVMGVESDALRYAAAVENQLSWPRPEEIFFFHADAAKFDIQEADAFYFFNPFSETVLRPVIHRILSSFYEHERSMKLFFYYPSAEYERFLFSEEELEFFDDISCRDLFEDPDPRESILVFGIG